MWRVWIAKELAAFITYVTALGTRSSSCSRAALHPVRGAPELLEEDHVDDALRSELGRAWREVARGEGEALVRVSRRALELASIGAPIEIVRRAHEIAACHARQLEQCVALARRIDGDASRGTPTLPRMRRRIAWIRTFALARIATETVTDGWLRDAMIVRLDGELARRATDPAIRAVLEERAAEAGRRICDHLALVRWCVSEGGAPVEQALAAMLALLPIDTKTAARIPRGALEGGWERWGIAGMPLARQAQTRAIEAARLLAARRGRGSGYAFGGGASGPSFEASPSASWRRISS
jgi:hypothetical protein